MSLEELLIDIGKSQREENFNKNVNDLKRFISGSKVTKKKEKTTEKLRKMIFQLI